MTAFEITCLAVVSTLAIILYRVNRYLEQETADEIIAREMAAAPPTPVHDDVLELCAHRDQWGGRLPSDASEMDAVRLVISSLDES